MTDLYHLLPQVYQRRDADSGYALRGLLAVIEEQRQILSASLEQLYDDWFIETCQDWLVPYLGDLVGYQLLHGYDEALARGHAGGGPPAAGDRTARRRGAHDRRAPPQGHARLLEDLARDVAGWPARAVEFRRLLAFDQPVRLDRSPPADSRPGCATGSSPTCADGDRLDLVDGPFDRLAHTVDVRRIDLRHPPAAATGSPQVGLFAWRLRSYSITRAPAYCDDRDRTHYTFSILGNDTPLVTEAVLRAGADPHRRRDQRARPSSAAGRFDERTGATTTGRRRACASGSRTRKPVPLSAIVPADLSGWALRAAARAGGHRPGARPHRLPVPDGPRRPASGSATATLFSGRHGRR